MGPVLANTCKGLHRASIDIHLQRASEGHYRHTPTKALEGQYSRIFVYTFYLINIWLSLFDDANKVKTLNIEKA